MVEIRLTNSKTRRKEVFRPLDPKDVRMYLCGPTVYDRAHLGNARPVVVFDVLYRLLRHVYGADHVTYVRNFTDVDDKINARAAATGRPIRDITDETIRWYHEDMDALGALRPDHEPRATDYIPQMIAMIEALIAKGHAYVAEGHVLFDVRSYPAYGQLSGRSVDDMIAGARVEVAPFKRDPMDFVLWKPSSGGEPGWDSPWGLGRPGWHIECSAMSAALLGESFDIHGGGLDLMFPHHENEIAQSCCAHPDADFAKVWLHNEMLQVEGKKMSKSLGNFFTVRDLLDQGIRGEVIRLVMLRSHYRKPMDWTAEKVREAKATLQKWRGQTKLIAENNPVDKEIVQALADDLNTSECLTILNRYSKDGEYVKLKAGLSFLGIRSEVSKTYLHEVGSFPGLHAVSAKYLDLISNVWIGGRPPIIRMSGSETEDELRDRYENLIKETIQGTADSLGVDRSVIEMFDRSDRLTEDAAKAANEIGIAALIEKRTRAKKNKNFAEADRLRGCASEVGIELRDTPDGTVWRMASS